VGAAIHDEYSLAALGSEPLSHDGAGKASAYDQGVEARRHVAPKVSGLQRSGSIWIRLRKGRFSRSLTLILCGR
jgi:hypothetical protein